MRRIFMLLLLVLAAGCRQSTELMPTTAVTAPAPGGGSIESSPQNVDFDVTVDPPAQVGDASLQVALSNNGEPLPNLPVAVRGDMNHAGMRPVLAEGTTDENGVANMPFEWTMGGDWIVTVTVTLPNGSQVTQDFDFTVSS